MTSAILFSNPSPSRWRRAGCQDPRRRAGPSAPPPRPSHRRPARRRRNTTRATRSELTSSLQAPGAIAIQHRAHDEQTSPAPDIAPGAGLHHVSSALFDREHVDGAAQRRGLVEPRLVGDADRAQRAVGVGLGRPAASGRPNQPPGRRVDGDVLLLVRSHGRSSGCRWSPRPACASTGASPVLASTRLEPPVHRRVEDHVAGGRPARRSRRAGLLDPPHLLPGGGSQAMNSPR